MRKEQGELIFDDGRESYEKTLIQATWTSEELIIRPRRIELRICRFNAVTSEDRMRASSREQDTVWLLLGRSNTCGDIFKRQSIDRRSIQLFAPDNPLPNSVYDGTSLDLTSAAFIFAATYALAAIIVIEAVHLSFRIDFISRSSGQSTGSGPGDELAAG
jgi:hypothetical protein